MTTRYAGVAPVVWLCAVGVGGALLAACDGEGPRDAGAGLDAATLDAAGVDAAMLDAAMLDAAMLDAGHLDAARLDGAVLDAGPLDGGPPDAGVGFAGSFEVLPASVRARMDGVSWRAGCPVGLDGLAYLRLRHWGLDGSVHDGEMVVAMEVAPDVVAVFEELFDARFPIARMQLVDDYGADDDRSMEANNTSAFNCRRVTGGSSFSQHSYGDAIDINPIQNPYVRGGTVLPPAGTSYTDRADVRPAMIVAGDDVTAAFDAIGWRWGGDFTTLKDYQHFSRNGR